MALKFLQRLLDKQRVFDNKDSYGHGIKITGRSGIIYTEGDMNYFVDSEMQVEPKKLAI